MALVLAGREDVRMDIQGELLALSDHWSTRFRARLEGVTDEEFFWEPAPGCWSLRPDADGVMHGDFGLVFTEEAPVTTIAWRVAHIIDMLKEDRCALLLGLEPEPSAAEKWLPASVEEALDMLERAYAAWRRYLSATDADKFGESIPRTFQARPSTRLTFILHILDELVHHGAEVALLRDLWRANQPRDEFVDALLGADPNFVFEMVAADPDALGRALRERPDLVVEAAATARWGAIPVLLALGFPVEGSTGRSALHHAAADGNLELVHLLIQHGANIGARDPIYNVTPIEWARFFSRDDVIEFLSRMP
jgi:hypothetical protein